jgi:hypothetical protein
MPSVLAGGVGPLSLCLLIASRRAAVMPTVRMLKVPPYADLCLIIAQVCAYRTGQ